LASSERFRALREKIIRRDTLQRESKEAEKYIERLREIKGLREQLVEGIQRVGVLRSHRIEIGQLRDTSSALQALTNYQLKVSESPGESGREHGLVKKALDSLCGSVDEAADASLKRVIAAIPTVEEVFLRQVETNPLYAKQVADVRAARDALKREALTAGSSSAELSQFLTKREALRTLAEQLKPSEFPQEVLDFFKAARQGAPLEKLTDTVKQWLTERDQLRNIRLIVVER
jgi:hypothetical protein